MPKPPTRSPRSATHERVTRTRARRAVPEPTPTEPTVGSEMSVAIPHQPTAEELAERAQSAQAEIDAAAAATTRRRRRGVVVKRRPPAPVVRSFDPVVGLPASLRRLAELAANDRVRRIGRSTVEMDIATARELRLLP